MLLQGVVQEFNLLWGCRPRAHPPSMSSRQLACAAAAGCVVGAFVSHRWRRRPAADDGDEAEGEEDHAAARARVWRAIGGAMTAAQL